MLDRRLQLHRVATVVDAVSGGATLDRFAEAARQAAIADALIVSKTDLAPLDAALAGRLEALNPAAEAIIGAAAAPADILFAAGSGRAAHAKSVMPGGDPGIHAPATGAGREDVDGRVGHDDQISQHAAHTHGIATVAVELTGPVGRLAFAQALGGLARSRGNDLLRVKGLVAFADRPERPAVVQAAQHAMFAPEWLDAWPDDDRRSRLVFIVQDISRRGNPRAFRLRRAAPYRIATASREARTCSTS